jgi:magnesium-transporting ATPase (P-type)
VAMGLEGTEVAKGASDMILTDDNFCSIVDAIEQGRIIYAGIQKFVSFIMSVHFAEVIQIFLCIICNIPVMRQPLQILFLILVTDLPPSIALGFEPGEALTMQRKPRVKTQPVVVAWMWFGIVANGMILTICIFSTYILCLWAYAGAFLSEDIIDPKRVSCAIWPPSGGWTPSLNLDCGTWTPCLSTATASQPFFITGCGTAGGAAGWAAQTMYTGGGNPAAEANKVIAATAGADGAMYTPHGGSQCDICVKTSIRRARTTAFISLVWAEGFRAYVSRSFDNGVWVDTFSNPSMNKAVLMAQVTLFIALYLPGFNDAVLGLYPQEIHGFGWGIAFIGAFACLVFCEVFKCYSKQFVEEAELANYSENDDGSAVKTDEVNVHVEMTEAPAVGEDKPARDCC